MGANGGQRRGGPADIAVRTGAESDAAGAASLHADQIAEGFLSFLGPRFLTRLYRRIILSPDAFVLIADDAGRVVGFIAGAADIGRLYRSFPWHDGIRAGVDAARRLLRGWRRASARAGCWPRPPSTPPDATPSPRTRTSTWPPASHCSPTRPAGSWTATFPLRSRATRRPPAVSTCIRHCGATRGGGWLVASGELPLPRWSPSGRSPTIGR